MIDEIETTVLIIQPEVLDDDEHIRKKIAQHGFIIRKQRVTHFSLERAQVYIDEVANMPDPTAVEEKEIIEVRRLMSRIKRG